MVESIKKISNPLTIIAIFAALAEVSATTAFPFVNKELQGIFIYFVMGFPTLLVILFFVTLNFNPKVMYAPSDFQDETNFLTTIQGPSLGKNSISITKDNIGEANKELKKLEEEFSNDLVKTADNNQILDFANTFFIEFSRNITEMFDNNSISGISFGIHSNRYFLLGVEYSEDISGGNHNPEDHFILYFTKSNHAIELTIIGKDIKGKTPNEIVPKVINYIDNQIRNIKKMRRLREKEVLN